MVCTTVLTSCAQLSTTFALSEGSRIHSFVQSGIVKQDTQLYTALMNMYVKCKQPDKALQIWTHLKESKLKVTSHITCLCVLNACAAVGTPEALAIGELVHSFISSKNWNQPTLFNALGSMYTKCGKPEKALQVWRQRENQTVSIELCTSILSTCAKIGPQALNNGIEVHSQVSASKTLQPDLQYYAALVNMYSKCGQPNTALLVWETLQQGNLPGYKTYPPLLVAMLTACASLGSEASYKIGANIHSYAQKCFTDQVDANSTKIYYTALISMYTKCDHPERAIAVYDELQQMNIQLSLVTYICLVTACAAVGPAGLKVGKQLCFRVEQEGIATDVSYENSVLSMLVKCGAPQEALDRWKALQVRKSFVASTVTYICALAACADLGPNSISHGTQLHSLLSDKHLEQEDVMAALVNMYARCGDPLKSLALWTGFVSKAPIAPISPALYTAVFTACATIRTAEALEVGSSARQLLEQSGAPVNVITTTAMIQMYSRCGDPGSAFSLWSSQLRNHPLGGDGSKTDKIRILSALSVCSTLRTPGALQLGKQLARTVSDSPNLKDDIVVLTALIGMYERCGAAELAITVWKDINARHIQPTDVTYPGI